VEGVNTMTWTVAIEAAGAEPAPRMEDFLDELDEFNDLLVSLGASTSASQDCTRYGATFTPACPEGTSVEDVANIAVHDFRRYAEKAGLPAWPVVKLEVLTWAKHDSELVEPLVYELVGISEIAREIGVTRQRASKLARQHGFPAPIVELASGPVWTRSSLTRFVDHWNRKPGRPAWPIDADEVPEINARREEIAALEQQAKASDNDAEKRRILARLKELRRELERMAPAVTEPL